MFEFDLDDIVDTLMIAITIIHAKKRFSAIFFWRLSVYINFTFSWADRNPVNSTDEIKTTCEQVEECSIENPINDRCIASFI